MGGCSDAKVTKMVLEVDLDCYKCYRKVKRLLCKFPQIRDQWYDEKQKTVSITVVCCSPEKIRDKLCCKGGKSIKSIKMESKKPPPENKPKSEDKPKAAAGEGEKSKPPPSAAGPADKSKVKPVPEAAAQKPPEKAQKKESPQEPKPAPDPAPKQADAAPKAVAAAQKQLAPEPEALWVPGYPPAAAMSYAPCYGITGPCYQEYSPGPGPANYGYSYGRPMPGPLPPPHYYGTRSDYFTEENPTACSVM